jgi:putative ABC transport system permease protein
LTLRRFVRIALQRLRSIARGSALDAELERELAFHFDQLTRENVAVGMTPGEARDAARRALGNAALFADQCRDQRRVGWLHDLVLDVEYGFRTLIRNRVFTAVVVASLALGIGSNSAVLGVMNDVLFGELPLANADRLAVIRVVALDNPARSSGASLSDVFAWKERNRAFDAIELSLAGPHDLGTDENGTPPERITGQAVTPGLFALLGVQPLHGRLFTDAEDSSANAIVISHRLWQRRYAGALDVLGKSIRVDRGVRIVIGVMPQDFRYQDPRVDCWIPMRLTTQQNAGMGRFFGVIARLKPGVTIARAQADLSAIAGQLEKESPEHNKGMGVRVQSMRDALFGWAKEPLLILEAAVALVLLIASANVASLMLSRATVRRREIAMRISLGASRGRIVRQLLTESVLLALAGGALGLLVTGYCLGGLTALSPPIGSPWLAAVRLDGRIFAMTALLSIVTGLAFGLAPALVASQLNPVGSLKDGAEPATTSAGRWRSILVSAQLALAVILLVSSGLLLKSFVRFAGREINFDPAGLSMFEYQTLVPRKSLGQYAGFPYFELNAPPSQAIQRVYDRLRALPGVESAAGISYPPVDSLILPIVDIAIDSQPANRDERQRERLRAAYFLVTPAFFATMRTPVVRGRELNDSDTVSRPWVAIVNETAARRLWPGENPIGRRLRIDVVPEELPREVVGVVRDIPARYADSGAQPIIYASYLQQPLRYRGPWGGILTQMTFVIRHQGDPRAIVSTVRRAVADLDSDRPIASIGTAQGRLEAGLQKRRYFMILVGLLAITASMLAAVGVYGVLAYSVSQRTREIGIRKALGAGTRDVVVLIGRDALVLVAAGGILGSAAAWALTRLIASQLWTVAPTDPATFGGVALVLIAVAALACLGPARKALVIDPTVALREQ